MVNPTITIGELLREKRRAAELTQAELADRSGVTQGHISQIEKGERSPGLPTLRKLRDALGLDDGEFMSWVDVA